MVFKPIDREKADCVLINPPDDFSRYPYLGLCVLAAVLRQRGIKVAIIDSSALGYSPQDILDHLNRIRPKIVGISVMSMMLRFCYELMGKIREILPDCVLVAGGAHIDADPSIIQNMPVHCGFQGECELFFANFCENILGGNKPELLPGMIVWNGKELQLGEQPSTQDLNVLPMPAYNLLPLDRYFSPSTSLNTISFITSRGCPYNCSFCSKLRKKEYHYLSTENVIHQIDTLVNSYGIQWIEFVDEIFTLQRERIIDLCNQICSKGLLFQWGMATRADAIDDELLIYLKRAGCKKISFGIETGSERIRFAAHKKITNHQIIESIRLCKKHSIKTMGDFIFGHPFETFDEMRQTVSFSRTCGLNYAYFSRMIPIPNSEVFESAIKKREIMPSIWIDFMKGKIPFPLYNPEGISPDKIKSIYKRAWYSMYFWPTTLWRNKSVLFDFVRLFRTFIVFLKSISDKRYTK